MSGAFVVDGVPQRYDTGVDLDTGDDSLLVQQLDEAGAVVGLLVDGLVEQDDTGDGLAEGGAGGEQQLSVLPAVLFGVLGADVSQTFAHGAHGLVGG